MASARLESNGPKKGIDRGTEVGESFRYAGRLYLLIACGFIGGFIGVSLVSNELWLIGVLSGVAIGTATYFTVLALVRARR